MSNQSAWALFDIMTLFSCYAQPETHLKIHNAASAGTARPRRTCKGYACENLLNVVVVKQEILIKTQKTKHVLSCYMQQISIHYYALLYCNGYYTYP